MPLGNYWWGLSARGREALWGLASSSRVVWHRERSGPKALCGVRLSRTTLTHEPRGGRECGRCLRIAALDNA